MPSTSTHAVPAFWGVEEINGMWLTDYSACAPLSLIGRRSVPFRDGGGSDLGDTD